MGSAPSRPPGGQSQSQPSQHPQRSTNTHTNTHTNTIRQSSSDPYTYPGQRSSLSSSAPPGRLRGTVVQGSHVNRSIPETRQRQQQEHHHHQDHQQPQQPPLHSNPDQPNTSARTSTTPTPTTTTSAFSESQNNVATESNVRPGAYAVTRQSAGPAQVFRVTVPPGVRPNTEFSVHAGSRRVRVRCPPASRPGQIVQITLPPEPITSQTHLRMAPLTAACVEASGGGAVPMTSDVAKVNQAAADSGGTAQTFLVTIPPNTFPGMSFHASVDGQRFMVTCPENAGPGMTVRIVPPSQREEPLAAPKTQVFEVSVPPGVRANQPFTLMANGQRVLVTCPPNVVPGQKIRFQLPIHQAAAGVSLNYDGNAGGWNRTIRVTDLKFQWVHVNKTPTATAATTKDPLNDNSLDMGQQAKVDLAEDWFDFNISAYVRQLSFMEGNDARMRTAQMKLVPASEAVVDSRLVVNNNTLLSYADIASVQGKCLDEKTIWFQKICGQLTADWTDGHVKICIRREHLLQDSLDAIMSLGRDEMRKRWRFEFIGEPGIEAGGLTRDWFMQVSEQILDPDRGLWHSAAHNQHCMTINPASKISCPDDHLIYFRFFGRVLGRALFDRQLIKGHLERHIYKHLLGWPITFEDLEDQDEEYYRSLKKLSKMDNVSNMCLDFTATEETLGVHTEVELVEGGALLEVTNDNISEYLEANLQYRMLGRVNSQLTELLLGFFDVIPEPALTVFDSQELELSLCGLPEIEMEDWKTNTLYSGLYEKKGKSSKVVTWFWEVVEEEFDQEMRARLLQFVTGTSGVPARGFSVLQGNDGNLKKFTIHAVHTSVFLYPRAHTCFNRIDLPNYSSKKELEEKLRAAITLSANGFDME